MLCSINTFGTVVVVMLCAGFVVGVDFEATVVVVAIAARVVVVTVFVSAGDAPEIVDFKLAFPWNTARIFFDVSLSRSGSMTAMSSINVPVPGMV